MRGILTLLALVVGVPAVVQAAPQVELITENSRYQGYALSHDEQVCWLTQTDGSLVRVSLDRVTSFRKLSGEFRAKTAQEMVPTLKKEFGSKYSFASRGYHVVVAPRGRENEYAVLCDSVSRSFLKYFSRRGFRMRPISNPLVMIVFSSQEEFAKYCIRDGVPYSPILEGYYHPKTNRVALFTTKTKSRDSVRKTIIHEGIHQLAFNAGLHSRTGSNPRWVVEGLAMMLESDGIRHSLASSENVNRTRLDWFRVFNERDRKTTIADLIADGEPLFRANALNTYSESWALTYFLAETRSADYARYLHHIANRKTEDGKVTEEDRLREFEEIFSEDLGDLEVEFQRYIGGLK